MSLKLGNTTIAGISRETKLNAHSLLDFKWTDHILNEMSWLRADTFSWQSGDVYTSVYNLLVSEWGEWWSNHTASDIEFDGHVYYATTKSGFKIAHSDEVETGRIQNVYDTTGVAWYYILDTENRRFKLPRTKYGFTGLRDGVGKYVPESLPNIKGSLGVQEPGSSVVDGCFYKDGTAQGVTAAYASRNILKMDASLYSSTYQDNAPVQQRATQMYLYFYVGEFSQTATEQTAGITTEQLNNKADISASNFNSQGKSLISGLGMPSGRYIDLTLGASGSTYTAPANGWIYCCKQSSGTNQNINITIDGNMCDICWAHASTLNLVVSSPIKKGKTFSINYTTGGATQFFKFIYAEGEENV